ncbi:MAG TPA: nucleotidyltransferase family protein [Gemmatimonadales bacterium]|nr:nucleotidyltransferase family protein [Gemmatimonadales bacterium]
MPDARFAAVVLAAGASRRMGPGRNKLLLEFDGEPLVRRSTRVAVDAGLRPVIVVLGFAADQVRRALGSLQCDVALNPRWDDGAMSASLHVGLRRVPRSSTGAIVLLADMVRVTAEMVRAVRDSAAHDAAPIVASRYEGVIAPPVRFHRSIFPELVAWTGEGFKSVVQRHGPAVRFIDWPAQALADVDSPGDLERQPGIITDH